MEISVLNRVVRDGLSDYLTFEQRSEGLMEQTMQRIFGKGRICWIYLYMYMKDIYIYMKDIF